MNGRGSFVARIVPRTYDATASSLSPAGIDHPS